MERLPGNTQVTNTKTGVLCNTLNLVQYTFLNEKEGGICLTDIALDYIIQMRFMNVLVTLQ